MRVLQINKYLYPKGGAETYMFQLSDALKESGVKINFWGMQDDFNIVEDQYDSFVKNVNYQKLPISEQILYSFKTIYSTESKKRISIILDKFKPDIVHLHNYNFQLTPAILPEIKKRGIKIVQTIHDSQMVCPYHRLYNFQKKKICTKCVTGSFSNCIKDRCFDGSYLKSILGATESYYYHNLKYYEKYIDLFISPSNFLAGLIQQKIKNKPFKTIPNFTDIISNIKKKEGDYYLYYGRISKEKGVIELIDIFKDLNLQLFLIGEGDQENELVNAIKNLSNIKFLGPKNGIELFTYVANAKFVIQPSKWFENCPMTVIESFAYNTPVIAANHSGFKDLIKHGKTGFLLNFDDKKVVKQQIFEISKKNHENLKKNIDSEFQHRFGKEKHISTIIDLYKTLLFNN